MKRLLVTLLIVFLFVSCKMPDNRSITGLIIKNNEYTLNSIKKNFPNLKSITFTDCDMSTYDIGKLEIYIREVIISKGCYGELLCSEQNHMINKLELDESNISRITPTFLDNIPNLDELISFNTDLKEISFPRNCSITELDIFNASITDFTSLSNLHDLKKLRISQLHYDYDFDISSIVQLNNIESLHLSSNFHVNPSLKISNIKKLNIVSKEQTSQSLEKLLIFPSLQTLVVQSFYNVDFPEYLKGLSNLTSLVIINSTIEYFPTDLSQFQKLESIEFVNHNVNAFPDDILFPKSLKYLYINGDTFPMEEYRIKYPDIHFEILEI